MVDNQNKQSLLIHLLQDKAIETVLIFTQMKHAADKLARVLNNAGIRTEVFTKQIAKCKTGCPCKFKARRTRVLVATDKFACPRY